MTLPILYADDSIIAVNKPAGLLVHRSAIDRTETRFLVQMLRDQIGKRVYPVHRLDKPTSGVLVFALSSKIARALNESFSNRKVSKKYVAVVRGFLSVPGVIDYPLKEQLDRIADAQAQAHKAAQSAVTRYRPMQRVEVDIPTGRYATSRYSLVELCPETGRKHQLRRHMKHISHQIIGDTTHGDGKHNQTFRKHFNSYRLLLCATELEFDHPAHGKRIVINAGLGDEFERVLERFGWIA